MFIHLTFKIIMIQQNHSENFQVRSPGLCSAYKRRFYVLREGSKKLLRYPEGVFVMPNPKKVGILTFSYSSNGGSVMQTYALQKTISSIEGYEASVIHYTKTYAGKPILGKNVFTKSIKNWTPKNIVMWSMQLYAYPRRMRKYEKFFKQYYNGYSDHAYSREELPALAAIYDKFVVGSDQVWNYNSPQVDDTFFLDFVEDDSKKISYAPSFGKKNVPEDKQNHASQLISKFSAISVREPDGVTIVSELTGREATWVLDPSLLLDKQEYHKLSTPPKKKGYIYLYLRERSPKLEEFAKKLARAKGLSVIKVHNHWLCRRSGMYPVGPHEWLGYMENADYVVTNSFHGICFSIIFEKEFYVDYLKKSPTATNARIEGMLNQFGLAKRCISDIQDLNSLDRIDYLTVNRFKARRQEESLSYLRKALKGNKVD